MTKRIEVLAFPWQVLVPGTHERLLQFAAPDWEVTACDDGFFRIEGKGAGVPRVTFLTDGILSWVPASEPAAGPNPSLAAQGPATGVACSAVDSGVDPSLAAQGRMTPDEARAQEARLAAQLKKAKKR